MVANRTTSHWVVLLSLSICFAISNQSINRLRPHESLFISFPNRSDLVYDFFERNQPAPD